MSRKIYKLCLVRGFTEAYHQLSEEGKQSIWNEVESAMKKADSKMVTPYYNCRWSNEQYQTFFIIEYPDADAAIADATHMENANWHRYINAETILAYDGGMETANT